jgi:hypothetical protein
MPEDTSLWQGPYLLGTCTYCFSSFSFSLAASRSHRCSDVLLCHRGGETCKPFYDVMKMGKRLRQSRPEMGGRDGVGANKLQRRVPAHGNVVRASINSECVDLLASRENRMKGEALLSV